MSFPHCGLRFLSGCVKQSYWLSRYSLCCWSLIEKIHLVTLVMSCPLVMGTFTHQVCAVVEGLCTIATLRGQQECTIPQKGHPGFLGALYLVSVCFLPALTPRQESVSGSEPAAVEVNCTTGTIVRQASVSGPPGVGQTARWGGAGDSKGQTWKKGQYSSD